MKYALAALGLAMAGLATAEGDSMRADDFESIDGQPMNIAELGAKAVLVVNTASKCGYTPQYEGLEALYEAKKDDGLVIVGVPSNDFGGQEPGTEAEVKSFCELNYGVTFPLTIKYKVVGAHRHPFWDAAVAHLGELAEPKWNFHKVLVSADGTPLKAYASGVTPEDPELLADIEAELSK
jgi:glutathione peroxidase